MNMTDAEFKSLCDSFSLNPRECNCLKELISAFHSEDSVAPYSHNVTRKTLEAYLFYTGNIVPA